MTRWPRCPWCHWRPWRSAAKPATYRQKRDGSDETVEGQAQRIDYDSRTETVKLTGQAVFRRYRGAQLNDETTGTVIVYDGRTEVFTVQGGGGTGAGNARGSHRPVARPSLYACSANR